MRLELLPDKPKKGSPCNGCGYCCAMEVCALGLLAHPGASAPCPELRMSEDETRFVCGLVEDEIAEGGPALFQSMLGVGMGCDSDDD